MPLWEEDPSIVVDTQLIPPILDLDLVEFEYSLFTPPQKQFVELCQIDCCRGSGVQDALKLELYV